MVANKSSMYNRVPAFRTTLDSILELQLYTILKQTRVAFYDCEKQIDTGDRTDHIFNLKCLIDFYLFRGENFSMLSLITERLLSHLKSEPFVSNIGVRKGENLSPVLFSLFLNELTEFIAHAYNGLDDISEMAKLLLGNDEIEVFFKLYILLYADDTVILAESKEELQSALNAMYLYCKSWGLEVNPSKTKITIFRNKKFQHNYVFTYNGQALDIDDNFVYLGTLFSYNGRFLKNNQRMVDQARKAMFSILRKSRKLQLPIDL